MPPAITTEQWLVRRLLRLDWVRRHELMEQIEGAIQRPGLGESSEDFSLFHFEEFEGDLSAKEIVHEFPMEFARLLRAESEELGDEESVANLGICGFFP